VLSLSLSLTTLGISQTRIVAPKNKYTVAEDVKLGREASAQAKKELPMLNHDRVDNYVERVGRRLAEAVPPEFQHPEFTYTFDVINQKDINAFALPGGPMFLNRGMIEAAKTEGEVAGVMAHEMSHVALRHGTAQASSGQGAQIGGILGQIAGAINRWHSGQHHLDRLAGRGRGVHHKVQPCLRVTSRPAWRPDAGARRLRPARNGEHVQDARC
jgi:predicted Zn-dependent protease